MKKITVAVLVSGGGTNLQAILNAEKRGELPHAHIGVVVSSRPDAYALERAKKAGVPTVVAERKKCASQEEFERGIERAIESVGAEVIVLAGFMSILSEKFTSRYPERIINVHPSLIPKFCGKGFYGLRVHEAVLAAGEKVTGATVHYVNEVPDGGRIIFRKEVPVMEGDTPEILQRRVMEEAEWQLLPRAVELTAERVAAEHVRKEIQMDIYKVNDINALLGANTYPGRGIVLGRSADGKHAVFAYFIMGRSENSRNRVFVEKENELVIYPFDESKVEDPSLIIYSPVKKVWNKWIVTNGDQTDTVEAALLAGESFESALEKREFEPDAPNYTPRISGLIDLESKFVYKLSILKSADEKGSACNRYSFSYEPVNGLGHFIHTYNCDGNPIPTFTGEPERVAIGSDLAEFANGMWENLNAANKIALYVGFIDLKTYRVKTMLFNKHSK